MSIKGELKTMLLAEVLQWVGGNRKTGLLEIERGMVTTKITFRDGRIVGCSSTDPSTLLGHFLISRGKITERTLRYALARQGDNGMSLPEIFVEIGVLTEDELAVQLIAKAEETICGLFEWDDGLFRFRAEAPLDRHSIEVDLSVEEILRNGSCRHADLRQFREVFPSSAVVVRRTDRPLPADLEFGAVGLQVLELCIEERSLAEIVLRVHASEYQVLKLLLALHSRGNVEIVREDPVNGDVRTPSDCSATVSAKGQDEGSAAPAGEEPRRRSAAGSGLPDDDSGQGDIEPVEVQIADPYALVRIVTEKFDNGDEEGAIEVLESCYRVRPHDEFLKRMLDQAEEAYLRRTRGGTLQPDRIPVAVVPPEKLSSTRLDPTEATLLGLIDGETNVQSILWIVPLHEIQIMKGLERLHGRGLVRLEEPPPSRVVSHDAMCDPVEP